MLINSKTHISKIVSELEEIAAPSVIISSVSLLESKCDECYEAVTNGDHEVAVESAANAVDLISLLETVRLSMGECDVRLVLTDLMIGISGTMIDLVSIANGGEIDG